MRLITSGIAILTIFPSFNSTAHADTYTYDDLNRLVKVAYANGSSISYSYDEVGNRLSTTVVDGRDPDGDGLTNTQEATLGTNPTIADTDGDGLTDGEEDANHNGQRDANETNPLSADTDGDGMPDGWEVTRGLSPLVDDAAEDPDGDGYTNLEEYQGNSLPNVATSFPGSAGALMGPMHLLLGDEDE